MEEEVGYWDDERPRASGYDTSGSLPKEEPIKVMQINAQNNDLYYTGGAGLSRLSVYKYSPLEDTENNLKLGGVFIDICDEKNSIVDGLLGYNQLKPLPFQLGDYIKHREKSYILKIIGTSNAGKTPLFSVAVISVTPECTFTKGEVKELCIKTVFEENLYDICEK